MMKNLLIFRSHINVVPAKFVPSVLKRNQVKPSAVSIDQQPTVSSTSVATIDKVNCFVTSLNLQ